MNPRGLRPAGQRLRVEGASTPVRLDIRPDWRQTTLQAITTLASIASVLLVALGLLYTNESNRKQQEATRQQLEIAEQGQLTDRFGRAVEQLGQEGNDKQGVRMGGIYALERLTADSSRDEPAIIEVLCAFIRTHAVTPSSQTGASLPASPPDVQAAFTVLAHRPHPNQPGSGTVRLTNARLSMPGADLRWAHLGSVDLRRASFSGADLYGADLFAVKLAGANLSNSILSGTLMAEADLQGADLRGAILSGAILDGANLAGADLRGANLRSMYLETGDMDNRPSAPARVTSAQLRCTWVDTTTQLPDGIARPMANAPAKDLGCRS